MHSWLQRPDERQTKAEAGTVWPARRPVLWGVSLLVLGSLAPVLAGVLACSPYGTTPTTPVAATRGAAPRDIGAGPPPPDSGLPMPTLELEWAPASAAAGDVTGLASAVASHPRVGLAVDPSIVDSGALDAMRLAAVVGKLAPDTALHPIDVNQGVALGGVLLEDPPLLPELGEDGRVRWQLPPTLAVDEEQLRRWSELGDPAVLLVGPVGVDGPSWRELAAGQVGGCEPLLQGLLDGQRDSLALLEPFLDYADAVLSALYLDELEATLPALSEELSEFEAPGTPGARTRSDFRDADEWERHQCGQQARAYLEPFQSCAAEPSACTMTPRVFINGAARIGTAEPTLYIADHCPERLERDYVEALRAPARTAADLAGDHLDAQWMILAERLATLTEVYGAAEALCTPARRRFATSDVEAMRASMREISELYRQTQSPAHDARFLANDASFRVPGLGVVRQLARYDAGSGSAARALDASARQLRELERGAARCTARPGTPPVMTLLLDTATGEADFLGFYYAEELWCEELGPLH